MKVYAHEPPWTSWSPDFGRWVRGEEMWDGSGWEWTLDLDTIPPSAFTRLLLQLTPRLSTKVEWLEDELMPMSLAVSA